MAEFNTPSRRWLLALVAGYLAIAIPVAITQVAAIAASKAPAFEVVSIRPNNSGTAGSAWGVSENRYRAKNTPLSRIILQAYLDELSPSDDRLKGAPPWVTTDRYDITAKADDATADSWKGLRQAQQVAKAAPMLRSMLEDRCKLAVHTVPGEVDTYALEVGKHGIKMKEAQPDEPVPERVVRFEGGWMMVISAPDAKPSLTLLQVTMAQLTAFLSLGRAPIVDQTGLTGKYDVELPRLETIPPPGEPGATPPLRPDPARMFDWGAIGLEMKPIKIPTVNLVIDHIERPTEN